jgi:hypothetical protein
VPLVVIVTVAMEYVLHAQLDLTASLAQLCQQFALLVVTVNLENLNALNVHQGIIAFKALNIRSDVRQGPMPNRIKLSARSVLQDHIVCKTLQLLQFVKQAATV